MSQSNCRQKYIQLLPISWTQTGKKHWQLFSVFQEETGNGDGFMQMGNITYMKAIKYPTGCPYPNRQNGAKHEREIRITERGLHRVRRQNALSHSGAEGF